MYRYLLKPILFRFDPEDVHDLFIWIGRWLGSYGLGRWKTRLMYGYRGPDASRIIDGIRYPAPILLSAGFDYNAWLSRILPCIGFGGEEAGSVTARPCAGNPKPRLTRLPLSQSILVNKGLRNDGVDTIAARLRELADKQARKKASQRIGPKALPEFVLGISIARTNDAESATIETGIEDYAYSFRRLNEEGVGDYYTINISCPNAFGGEAFATPALLERLLARLKQIPCAKPIYIKMPINLPWPQFAALLDIIDRHGMHGVVIGNLNKDYSSLDVRSEAPAEYRGGLSGKPCRALSLDLIRKTRAAYGARFTIFGVGGIMTPAQAIETFEAGADAIQLITGLIYNGPSIVGKMRKAYAASIAARTPNVAASK